MKPITKTLSVLFICIVVSSFVRAQESAVSVQPQPAATDFETLLQVLEATKPFPATATPKSGTFYTVQNGENWPPLPGNLMDLPFWDLGDGFYLLDDRDINYVELRAEAAAKEEISGGEASRMSMSMNNNAWGSVYLTNLVTTFSSNQIASFDIAGGINYVPYDIWRTTDLSNQISQLQ